MMTKITRSDAPVTLIGGGDLGISDLALALSHAPRLIAADSGAGAALDAGHMPDAVIGDFDSLLPEHRARIPKDRLFRIAEQDSTDFEKALLRIAAPVVVAVGFLGARVDHQLAALNGLVKGKNQPCILIGPHEVVFHLPPRFAVDLAPGAIVSLFPMARVTGRSRGLEWPIDRLVMAPDSRIGTSNRALGRIEIDMDLPGLLAILPRAALGNVIAALTPGAGVVAPR